MPPSTLVVDTLQPGTWCGAHAAARGRFFAHTQHSEQLLVCCQDVLSVHASDAPEEGSKPLPLLARLQLFEVLSAIARVPHPSHAASDTLLAVTSSGRCLLLALTPQPAEGSAQAPPSSTTLASAPLNSPAATAASHAPATDHVLVLSLLASVQLTPPPSLAPPALREDGLCISQALLLPHSNTTCLALSAFHDIVHVLCINNSNEGAPAMSVRAFDLKRAALLALKPRLDPFSQIRHSLHVDALEIIPPPIRLGKQYEDAWMLAVLHSIEGPGFRTVSLECLEHDPEQQTLVPGPWACRNMHPTTSLISHFHGCSPSIPQATTQAASSDQPSTSAQPTAAATSSASHAGISSSLKTLPPGMLAISSTSLLLLSLPTHPASFYPSVPPPTQQPLSSTPAPPASPSSASPSTSAAATAAASAPSTSAAAQGAGLGKGEGSQSGSVGSGGVCKVELLRYSMAGVPACMEVVWRGRDVGGQGGVRGSEGSERSERECVLIVADSMAGIYLMHLGGGFEPWMQRITVAGGPLSPAASLCFLPTPPPNSSGGAAQESTTAGLLFLGTTQSNSQVLQVPEPLFASQQQQQQAQQLLQSGQPAVWPMLDGVFIKSLAPVQDCVLVPDAQGAADATLLVGCGSAPFGRLSRAKVGCALAPYFSDGPDVPEGARLFALNSRTANTHLVFSFDALGYTAAMQLQGSTFTHTQLPGLRSNRPSLLLHTTPCDCIIQATREGLSLLSPLPHAHALYHWQPGRGCVEAPSASDNHTQQQQQQQQQQQHGGVEGLGSLRGSDALSLAAAWGCTIAVATATHVHCLQAGSYSITGGGGGGGGGGERSSSNATLRTVSSMEVPHQVSALHVCECGGVTAIVLGFWLQNEVVIVSAANPAHQLARVHLGEETARSAALLRVPPTSTHQKHQHQQHDQHLQQLQQVGDAWVLGVGTNSGLLMLWEVVLTGNTVNSGESVGSLKAGSGGESGGGLVWELKGGACARVSNVAVELSLLPDTAAHAQHQRCSGHLTHQSHSSSSSSSSSQRGSSVSQQQQQLMYAHSGSDAVVRAKAVHARAGVGVGVGRGIGVVALVEVVRVHGSSHLRSLCALAVPPSSPPPPTTTTTPRPAAPTPAAAAAAAASPAEVEEGQASSLLGEQTTGQEAARGDGWDRAQDFSMVWVTAQNRLLVGELDPEVALRWTTAYIGETPHHVAYHAASGCFVLLSEDASGQQWLRLVHGGTLQPVTSMKLTPGHAYTSLLVTALPCNSTTTATTTSATQAPTNTPATSSSTAAAAAAAAGAAPNSALSKPPPPKEFIVLGSHMLIEGGKPVIGGAALSSHSIGGGGGGGGGGDGNVGTGQGLGTSSTSTPHKPASASTSAGAAAARHGSVGGGGSGALQQVQGLVSVFEVSVQHAPSPARPRASTSGADGMELQYNLLLHGACLLDSVPLCLGAAAPSVLQPTADKERAEADAKALGTSPSSQPLIQPATDTHLIVGGHNGVRAYAVHVDDGQQSSVGGAEVSSALSAAQDVPPAFPAFIPPPEGLFVGLPRHKPDVQQDVQQQQQQQQGSGAAAMDTSNGSDDESDLMQSVLDDFQRQRHGEESAEEHRVDRATAKLRAALKRDWSQRVSLQQVDKAPTLAGFAVTSLACEGPLIVAADFMASVTIFTLQQQVHKKKATASSSGPASVLGTQPSSAPATPASQSETRVVLQASSVDRHPLCASAAVPCLHGQGVLTAVHPQGLVLMSRDAAAEREVWQQEVAEAEAEALQGRSYIRRQLGQDTDSSKPPLVIPAIRAPNLEIKAACRPRHPITHLRHGRLGLHIDPLETHSGQQQARHSIGVDEEGESFIALCADGSLLQLEATGVAWGKELLTQQSLLEQQQVARHKQLLHQQLQQQQQQQRQQEGGQFEKAEGMSQGGLLYSGLDHLRCWALQLPEFFSVARWSAQERAAAVQETAGNEGDAAGLVQALPCNCVDLAFLQSNGS